MFYAMQPAAHMFYVLFTVVCAHLVNSTTNGKVDEPMLNSSGKVYFIEPIEEKDTFFFRRGVSMPRPSFDNEVLILPRLHAKNGL